MKIYLFSLFLFLTTAFFGWAENLKCQSIYYFFQDQNCESTNQNLSLRARALLYSAKYDSAILFFKKSIGSETSVELLLEDYSYLIRIYRDLGDFKNIKLVFNELIKFTDDHPSYRSHKFYLISKAYHAEAFDRKNAGSYFENAISKFDQIDPDVVSHYVRYIDLLIEEFQFTKAKKILDKANIIADSNYSNIEPFDYYDLKLEKAYYTYRVGKLKESINLYNHVSERVKEQRYEWQVYIYTEYLRMISWSYHRLGFSEKAIKSAEQYLELSSFFHKKSYFRYFEVSLFLATVYKEQGNYEIASDYSEKVIESARDQQNPFHLTQAIYSSAELLIAEGKYDEAINKYLYIISLNDSTNTSQFFSLYCHYFIGKIYLDTGNPKAAIPYLEKGIDISKKRFNSQTLFLIEFIDALFRAYVDSKSYSQASQLVDEVFQDIQIDKHLNTRGVRKFLNSLSVYLQKTDMLDSCEHVLSLLLPEVQNNKASLENFDSFDQELLVSYEIRAEYNFKKYKNTNELSFLLLSVNDLAKCATLVSIGRNSFKTERDRIAFYKFEQNLTKNIVQKNVELSRHDFYFETSCDVLFRAFQLSKASHLLETLNRNAAIIQTNIPDSLISAANNLKQQSSVLTTRINSITEKVVMPPHDSVILMDYKSVLLDNKVRFNNLMLYLEKNFQKYYEIAYNPNISTVDEIQLQLSKNEAVIEYFQTQEDVHAFVISNDTAAVIQLKGMANDQVEEFREILSPSGLNSEENGFRTYTNQSFVLYDQLLAEPLSFLPKKTNKLFIIPDKSLSFLPFELLLTQKIDTTQRTNYGNLPYLIKEYDISYGYSASILFREDSIKSARKLNNEILAFAPSYEELLNDTIKLNQLGEFRNSLTPLKYNKSEVDGIGKYFTTKVFKADSASERAFYNNLSGSGIIHLAMHGLVDRKDQRKSKLVFTPVQDSIHDNYLHNFELYNTEIDVKLAVLSACDTGDGKLEGSEGVMSMARAFTYAGAQSVVMSQWPADDESSSIIMQSFYKYLAEGKRKDQALRLAKLDFLDQASPTKQNPYYWNNFVVTGDVSPIVDEGIQLYRYLPYLALIIVVITLAGFYIRRNVYEKRKHA